MKVLLYVGANNGNSVYDYLNSFDKIYLFEPLPDAFKILQNRFSNIKNVILVNAACGLEDGIADFYVPEINVCSGFLKLTNEFNKSLRDSSKKITVKTINLRNFLKKENIDYIDHYISDAQGFDFTILTTLSDLIEEKKINSLYIETHSDKAMIYENANNSFSNFKNILEKNYRIKFFSFDGKFVHPNDLSLHDGVSAMEWDSYWELK